MGELQTIVVPFGKTTVSIGHVTDRQTPSSHHLPRFVPSLPSLCRPTGSAVRGRSTRFCDILEYWLVMATEELFANALVQKEKQNKKIKKQKKNNGRVDGWMDE